MYLDNDTLNVIKNNFQDSKLDYDMSLLHDIDTLPIGSLKIHELNSKMTQNMDKQKFIMFANDVINNGLKEPIVVWKKRGSNFIIDGKHRYWLFKMLGIDIIPVKFLNTNYTKEQIMNEIISRDTTRKNQTKSQEYLTGYQYLLELGNTKENKKLVQNKFNITGTDMSKMKFIYEMIPIDYIDVLRKKGIVIIDKKPYRSIDSLYKLAKSIKDDIDANKKGKYEGNNNEYDFIFDKDVFKDVGKKYNSFLCEFKKAINDADDKTIIDVKRKIDDDLKEIISLKLFS